MSTCLIGLALASALGRLATLRVRPRRYRLPRPRTAVRGCIATTFLLTALGLVGLALLVARPT